MGEKRRTIKTEQIDHQSGHELRTTGSHAAKSAWKSFFKVVITKTVLKLLQKAPQPVETVFMSREMRDQQSKLKGGYT